MDDPAWDSPGANDLAVDQVCILGVGVQSVQKVPVARGSDSFRGV